jgi:hypothetical protein
MLIEEMVDRAREISFSTFAKRCAYLDLAQSMGYALSKRKGLKLQDDYSVSFYKSFFKGKPCYFMVQSAIEWIFTQ